MGMTEGTPTAGEGASLELDDIQSGALHERPSPYVGRYLLLRIDDRARRRRREQPRALGAAARDGRRARRAGGALARWRTLGGAGRAGTERARAAARRRGDLASGLLPAPDRTHLLRLQGRHWPARGRRKRDFALQPEG